MGDNGSIPQVQIVVAGQVIVQLDAVLEGLHRAVGEAQRGVILLAEVGVSIGGSIHGGGSRHYWW